MKTFSIGFAEASFDESRHARRVAAHFGTEHHEDVFTPNVMLDLIPTLADIADEPLPTPRSSRPISSHGSRANR